MQVSGTFAGIRMSPKKLKNTVNDNFKFAKGAVGLTSSLTNTSPLLQFGGPSLPLLPHAMGPPMMSTTPSTSFPRGPCQRFGEAIET